MKDDFLSELGFLGFTARVKRLSDKLMYDAKEHYQKSDLDIEPNWHLVLLLLKKEKALTVTEIAFKLGFSHPAIIKITKKMKDRGLIESTMDDEDNRRQVLTLSQEALENMPDFEKEWERIGEVIAGLLDKNFLQKLRDLEIKLEDTSFKKRCQK